MSERCARSRRRRDRSADGGIGADVEDAGGLGAAETFDRQKEDDLAVESGKPVDRVTNDLDGFRACGVVTWGGSATADRRGEPERPTRPAGPIRGGRSVVVLPGGGGGPCRGDRWRSAEATAAVEASGS